MPYKGQVISDNEERFKIEFLETSSETKGEKVKIKITQKSTGPLIKSHIHHYQNQNIKVLSGRLTYFLNNEKKYLNKGEEISLPKNVRHNHYNTDKNPVTYVLTSIPGHNLDVLLERNFSLIFAKNNTGLKSLISLYVLRLSNMKSINFFPNTPYIFQKVFLLLIWPLLTLFTIIADKKTGHN